LTQVVESTERAMALTEGSEDYIKKPFDPNELVARVRTVLSRVSPAPPFSVAEQLRYRDLVCDGTKRHAYMIDAIVPKEIVQTQNRRNARIG